MNFLSGLIVGEIPHCNCILAVESLGYAKAIFEIDAGKSVGISEIINALPDARGGDRLDVSLDLDGTPYAIDYAHRVDSVVDVLDEHGGDIDLITLTWVANKNPSEGRANLYSLAALEMYLNEEGALPFLEDFGRVCSEKIWIESDESEAYCRTESLTIGPSIKGERPAWIRKDVLQGRDDNCQISLPIGLACPLDFYFLEFPKSKKIKSVFDEIFKFLFLGYVCDRFDVRGDGLISYEVQGYKLVKEDLVPLNDFYIEYDHARKIFEWTYCEGGVSDKLGLLRNVISLESGDKGRLCTDGRLWAAVRSNYEIYLKKNVQQYIEVKNKVADLVFDYAERFSEYSRQFVSAFQGAAILLLTSLISLFFINGIGAVGVKGFFTLESFMLLFCVSVVAWLWLFVSYRSLRSNFDSAAVLIQRAIENNYSAILVKEEIEESLGDFIRSNRRHVFGQARSYAWVWALTPAILLLLFILAVFFKAVAGHEVGTDMVLAQYGF